MLGFVPLKRMGGDAFVGEGLRHVADGELVCGQGEHGASLALLPSLGLAECPTFASAAIDANRFPGPARIKCQAALHP